jgi:hypothetical protein
VQVGAAEQPVSGSHSAWYFRRLSANDRTPQTSPICVLLLTVLSVVRRGEYWASNPVPLLNISILGDFKPYWPKKGLSEVSPLGGKGSIKHSTGKSEITQKYFPDFPMNNLHLLRGFSSHAMITGAAWPQSYLHLQPFRLLAESPFKVSQHCWQVEGTLPTSEVTYIYRCCFH